LFPSLLDASIVFEPDTLLRWHRIGFRLFWRWKSRLFPGIRHPDTSFATTMVLRFCRHPENASNGHLRQILGAYADCYNRSRTHLALANAEGRRGLQLHHK
jgi:hypothetical protein